MRDQFMVSIGFLTKEATTASDQALGAWLRLCAYSAPRLLGGRLAGAQGWDAATWARVAGTTRRTADGLIAAGLARWDGKDLVLHGYDLHGEVVWQKKSQGGRAGNDRRWSATTQKQSPTGTPVSESSSDSDDNSDRSPNRRSVALRSESDASPSTVTDDPGASDPRLATVVLEGGWLEFKGKDLTQDWLVAIKGQTAEQIVEVMAWGRARTGGPIHFPGPTGYEGQRRAMADARRAAAAAERQRQEAEANRVQESERVKRQQVADQESRAVVGALLAILRDDPNGWTDRLTPAQATAISRLRDAYEGGRRLTLMLATTRDLPDGLLEQARTRAADTPAEVTP